MRNKKLKIPEDVDSIFEEIEYSIDDETKQKTLELTFVQHLRHTSIFTDSQDNGIELPTKQDFLSLKPGEIIKINI